MIRRCSGHHMVQSARSLSNGYPDVNYKLLLPCLIHRAPCLRFMPSK